MVTPTATSTGIQKPMVIMMGIQKVTQKVILMERLMETDWAIMTAKPTVILMET